MDIVCLPSWYCGRAPCPPAPLFLLLDPCTENFVKFRPTCMHHRCRCCIAFPNFSQWYFAHFLYCTVVMGFSKFSTALNDTNFEKNENENLEFQILQHRKFPAIYIRIIKTPLYLMILSLKCDKVQQKSCWGMTMLNVHTCLLALTKSRSYSRF
jgi:hypothetical protein